MQYQFSNDYDPSTVLDTLEVIEHQIEPIKNRVEHFDLRRLIRDNLSPYDAYLLGASQNERIKELLTEYIKNPKLNKDAK